MYQIQWPRQSIWDTKKRMAGRLSVILVPSSLQRIFCILIGGIFHGMIYLIVFCLRENIPRIRPDLRLVIISAISNKRIWGVSLGRGYFLLSLFSHVICYSRDKFSEVLNTVTWTKMALYWFVRKQGLKGIKTTSI